MTDKENEEALFKVRATMCAHDMIPICMEVSEEVYREAVEIALQQSNKYKGNYKGWKIRRGLQLEKEESK